MNKFLFVFMTLALCIAACSHNDNNVKTQDENDSNNELVIPTGDGIIPNAVTDIDGNTYKAVKLGDQIWMAENLKTKRYADGTSIYAGANESESEDVGYWYYPDDQASNMSTYGLCYNWKAVVRNIDTTNCSHRDSIYKNHYGAVTKYRIYNPSSDVQGICPNGWHVPSAAEWTQLTDYVSSQDKYVCGDDRKNIAKALASTTGWENDYEKYTVGHDKVLNNSTGFEALPYISGIGDAFWSSTIIQDCAYDSYEKKLRYSPQIICLWIKYCESCVKISEHGFGLFDSSYISYRNPVRCIRDNNQ